MTVFLAALDETRNKKGDFTLGGWLASEDDWTRYFEPAWSDRVLNGQKPIPYLHMSEIWNAEWQDKYRILGRDAYWTVEEAVTVIYSMGSLYPITAGVTDRDFQTTLVEPLAQIGGFGEIIEDPDYLCFIAFAIMAIQYVSLKCADATRVDFLIERSDRTTSKIEGFHSHLASMTEKAPAVHRLIGQLIPKGKESIPLQAADTLCWFVQREQAGLSSKADRRRLFMMANRPGLPYDHTVDYLQELAATLEKGMLERRAAEAQQPAAISQMSSPNSERRSRSRRAPRSRTGSSGG
jgi:hypothetical protein